MESCADHPSFGEDQSLPQPDPGKIRMPLASSSFGVPLHNLSILDGRINSLRRFLSESLDSHASIGDEHIEFISKEISSSIKQIIINGAALLSSSQQQSIQSEAGVPVASVVGKGLDQGASLDSPLFTEVNDLTENPSDLLNFTRKSPQVVDLVKSPGDLRVLRTEAKIAQLNTFSDSRNLRVPVDRGISQIECGNLYDPNVLKNSISHWNRCRDVGPDPHPSSDFTYQMIPKDHSILAAGNGMVDEFDPKQRGESVTIGRLKYSVTARDKKGDGAAEIIELDSVELLAEHMHFCEICGKGFKRDANLRMHKRAHGDQFKTMEALCKPDGCGVDRGRNIQFSCPFVGCNRNKSHRRFRPLKSVLCVKSHFRRNHCPKMFTCDRCNNKSFSVLSDLKIHLKHCGDCRWRCSCGTTFSRKDKLFGHVALFEGHMPAIVEEDKAAGANLEEELPVDRVEQVETTHAGVLDDDFLEGLDAIDADLLDELLGSV